MMTVFQEPFFEIKGFQVNVDLILNEVFIQLLRFLLQFVTGFGKHHPLHLLIAVGHKRLLNPLVEGSPLLCPLLDVSIQDMHLLLLLLHLSAMDIRHLPPGPLLVSSIRQCNLFWNISSVHSLSC